MKYSLLFMLPVVLLIPISQSASAQHTLMDQLTKAYQMFAADNGPEMQNMTEIDSKVHCI